MIGIKINRVNRNSVITRKPVDSIRSSFKSTQLSTLNPHHPSKTFPKKIALSIPVPQKQLKVQSKIPQNKMRTIQNSRKAPSAFSRVRKGGSFGGMNDHFLYQRKENHLNSCFNIRKNKLQEITKVNKQIYKRLNSQKSLYSKDDLNRSYRSIQVIKDRLSQSKMSQRSSLSRQSSKSSLRNSKSVRGVQPQKKNNKKPIDFKAQKIDQAEAKDLDKFKILFEKNINVRSSKDISEVDPQSLKYGNRKNGAYIRSIKVSGRMSMQSSKQGTKNIKSGTGEQMGGLLHRIMEDWTQNKENTCKKVK